MKVFDVLKDNLSKKDTSSTERLERNRVRASIESMCEDRLKDSNDILTFEALPSAINDVVCVLEEPVLAEKYEFVQVSETLFKIKLKELDII